MLMDTDVLSTFAKVDRLDLLFKVFHRSELFMAEGVWREVKRGEERGFAFTQAILKLVEEGRLRILCIESEDLSFRMSLPTSLALGELDSICICKRLGLPLISNERRVKYHCEQNGIQCFNLNAILRSLWRLGIMSKDQMKALMREMEDKDRLTFKSVDEIFQDVS